MSAVIANGARGYLLRSCKAMRSVLNLGKQLIKYTSRHSHPAEELRLLKHALNPLEQEASSFFSWASAESPSPVRRERSGGVASPPRSLQATRQRELGGGLPPSASRHGTIYVQSTSNNTICTLVDAKGNPVTWTSAGSVGFKNARKSTTYAAQATAEKIAAKSLERGFFLVRIVMKGTGFGKQSAVRALLKSGLRVSDIHEVTPLPHNGCRAPKKRRV